MTQWLLYGANGYTARLILEKALAEGLRPVLGGRSRAKIKPLADRYDLPMRIFPLHTPPVVDKGLDGIKAVLHAAGPYKYTAKNMVAACLRKRVNYLDISGEYEVFEDIYAKDKLARDIGISLIPGVGFDVVPTDCLAATLKEKVPDASHLELGFVSRGGLSHGTLSTMLEGFGGGCVRNEGELVPTPLYHQSREFRIKDRDVTGVAIPWGDISSAFHSTRIPNIVVYAGVSPKMARRMAMVRAAQGLVSTRLGKKLARKLVDRFVDGPSKDQRETGYCWVWGEASNAQGHAWDGFFRVSEGYTFTADASLRALRHVLDDRVGAGALTPSMAFGREFVESVPGFEQVSYRELSYQGALT